MGILILLLKVVVILASLLRGKPLFHGPVEVPCMVEGLLSGAEGRYLQDGDVSTAGA